MKVLSYNRKNEEDKKNVIEKSKDIICPERYAERN